MNILNFVSILKKNQQNLMIDDALKLNTVMDCVENEADAGSNSGLDISSGDELNDVKLCKEHCVCVLLESSNFNESSIGVDILSVKLKTCEVGVEDSDE